METINKSIEHTTSNFVEVKRETRDLIESNNNYNDLIRELEIEFLKEYEDLHIKSLFYTQKTLKSCVAMNITDKGDYFFTICKNKTNYKFFTSIRSVVKYLKRTNQTDFYLRLNDGYKLNYKNFEVFKQ